MTLEQRFLEKVEKKDGGCWEWLAFKDKGYGRLQVDGKAIGAHRIAYELYRGLIPAGMVLDHLCRNPGCVNPEHLEAVSLAENNRRSIKTPERYVKSALYQTSKTHCPRGHPYSGQNLYLTPHGRRACKICMAVQCSNRRRRLGKLAWNEYQRNYRLKRKALHIKYEQILESGSW